MGDVYTVLNVFGVCDIIGGLNSGCQIILHIRVHLLNHLKLLTNFSHFITKLNSYTSLKLKKKFFCSVLNILHFYLFENTILGILKLYFLKMIKTITAILYC